ncbi:MAG: hypothetical protein P8Y71_05015 [Pseudolabrys sp.]|jgi:hypothetical protein
MQKIICLCIAFIVLVVGAAGVVQQAKARWKPENADAPYRDWFAQQRTREGWSCCDLSDAHPVYDAYINEGKWHVLILGKDYEIQPYQLLSGPNPTGHAVVWYAGNGDYVWIFCFAPGPMY